MFRSYERSLRCVTVVFKCILVTAYLSFDQCERYFPRSPAAPESEQIEIAIAAVAHLETVVFQGSADAGNPSRPITNTVDQENQMNFFCCFG